MARAEVINPTGYVGFGQPTRVLVNEGLYLPTYLVLPINSSKNYKMYVLFCSASERASSSYLA